MYPTIYHALNDLLGVDWAWTRMLNSFGFFVALAFIIANYTLNLELRRKEAQGLMQGYTRQVVRGGGPNWADVITNAVLGFFIGWKIIYLLINSGRLFEPGSTPQSHIFSGAGYPLLGIMIAAALGGMRWWEYRKKQLPQPVTESEYVPVHLQTGTITFYAAVFGIIGAKLFHLFENPREFAEFFSTPDLQSFLSGLTVYGGLILGAAGVIFYAMRKKIPVIHLADAVAPGLILAYGIGRIGCQVSGDGDWGIVNTAPKPGWMSFLPDWLWAYDYPNNVNGVGVPITEGPIFPGYEHHLVPPVFPTPVYETLMAVLIFGVLWYLRKRIKTAGMITGLYLVFNGIERFLIEQIRVNNKFDFLGMRVTQAEVISTAFFISGLILIWWVLKKRPGLPIEKSSPA